VGSSAIKGNTVFLNKYSYTYIGVGSHARYLDIVSRLKLVWISLFVVHLSVRLFYQVVLRSPKTDVVDLNTCIYGCMSLILWVILRPNREEATGDWRKFRNEELYDFFTSPDIIILEGPCHGSGG
jgi:hypothetical protein